MITDVSLRPHIAWNVMLKMFLLKPVLKLHKYEQNIYLEHYYYYYYYYYY
jgi:hypothetical protein